QAQSEAQQKAVTAQATPTGPETILPPEETPGNPVTAKHHIEVGWIYDETNLKSPETLVVPLQTIRDFVKQQGGTVSAEIVDLDVPNEDRSPAARTVTDLGVRIDDAYSYTNNFSGQVVPQEEITEMLTRQMKAPIKK
ncbi:MAG: hypothetical protein M3Y13_11335, partial [Armatimonadota bacterium]|nr:hypothetical protein [Armatimonadota bacterium]